MASVNELKCNLCGSSERATVYIKDNVHILRCAQCGLLFNQEMKRPEDLSRIYSEDYFVGGDIGYGYDDYPAQRDNLLRTFRNRFKVVEQYKGPGRLLSVGCGLGCCVQVAREKNWQAQAVEISGFACEWMKRNLEFGAHNCALKDAHFPDNHFDVVLMWGYIQESLDPLGEIKEVYRILKPGGMLFLQAQNTDSLYARLAREKWIQFKPRTTAYYFSRKTARMLLEKAGFKVLKITPSGMGQYCSVDFLLKRITHLVPALERINQLLSGNGRLKRTSVYINLFDLLHLYAKKEDNNG
ncbi:MAG: class I SAM-dependent methyltransferase [Candidatus Omnitrophota bacterium]